MMIDDWFIMFLLYCYDVNVYFLNKLEMLITQ